MQALTSSPAETEAVAARLAARLKPPDVVLVSGELGAGKTTFVRGAAHALGVEAPVTSPTFTIGQVYGGRSCEIAHLDFYRLPNPSPQDLAILDDYLSPDRIAFVEWPPSLDSRVGDVAVRVAIEHAGGDRRRITIE